MSQAYMSQSFDADAPRIVRKDLTTITELIAKYRGLEQHFEDRDMGEVASALSTAQDGLLKARHLVEQLMPVLHGATAPNLSGASDDSREDPPSFEEKPPVSKEVAADAHVDAKGKALTVAALLVQAGFVSSSVVAKRAIKSGGVAIDGKPIANVNAVVEPGVYEVKCGELASRVQTS